MRTNAEYSIVRVQIPKKKLNWQSKISATKRIKFKLQILKLLTVCIMPAYLPRNCWVGRPKAEVRVGAKWIPQNEARLGARPLSLRLRLTLWGLSTRFRTELLKSRFPTPSHPENSCRGVRLSIKWWLYLGRPLKSWKCVIRDPFTLASSRAIWSSSFCPVKQTQGY